MNKERKEAEELFAKAVIEAFKDCVTHEELIAQLLVFIEGLGFESVADSFVVKFNKRSNQLKHEAILGKK